MPEVESLVIPGKAIHCHHEDVVAHIHSLEVSLRLFEAALRNLESDLRSIEEWAKEDSRQSAWFYEVKPELNQLVENSRWVSKSWKAAAWSLGAASAVAASWHAMKVFFGLER